MIGKIVLGLWLSAVMVAAFLYAPPALGLGDYSRIIYFHVPLAWVGVVAYLVSTIHAAGYLRTESLHHDEAATFNAEIGTLFTVLATATGAVFSQVTWGTYWNWDPRQTSIFFLLLIYGAFFALRSALEGGEVRARLSAVYLIFAFISVPFLVFIAPRVYASLHPEPILNLEGQLHMNLQMILVMLASVAGFSGLYAWLYQIHRRMFDLKKDLEEVEKPEGGVPDQ